MADGDNNGISATLKPGFLQIENFFVLNSSAIYSSSTVKFIAFISQMYIRHVYKSQNFKEQRTIKEQCHLLICLTYKQEADV